MSKTAERAAHTEKLKSQMMQVMGITDPVEFQRVARDYCKDLAYEMNLPAYHRLFTKIIKLAETHKTKFDALQTSKDRVALLMKLAMENEEIVDSFKEALNDDNTAANTELSSQKRTAGNQAFQKKQDKKALDLYSESVFAGSISAEGKKDVAMALANRSAVWVKLKKWKEGLDDIEAALLFDYPTNMMYKLVDRQAKCLSALGRVEEAKTCYNRVNLLLKQSGLDKGKQDDWSKEVAKELTKLNKLKEVKQELIPNKCPKLESINKKIPQFSDGVDLEFNPLVGRHATASRDIDVGEVIMLDTSMASHLLCGTAVSHCTYCMRALDMTRSIPSTLTQSVRFCNTTCLKAAMSSYHSVEAKVNIERLFWNKKEEKYEEMSGCILLTYRAITQKSLEFFSQIQDYDIMDEEWGTALEDGEKLLYSDYKNLWNLTAHRDQQTKEELLSLSCNTTILLILLRFGEYFGQKETPYAASMSSDEIHIASIICHLQEGIRYNLHTVNDALPTKMSGITSPHTREVGSAMFPTLLLLNHSCDPNTVRLNVNGDQVMVVAKRTIKKGEEISDNYGIHHLSMALDERQQQLHQGFKFCCWCGACQGDFPRLKSLKSQLPEDVEDEFDKSRDTIKEIFKKGQHEECLKNAISMIKMLEKAKIGMPHRNYELGALALLSCLWTLYGNKAT